MKNNRRDFIKTASIAGAGIALAPNIAFGGNPSETKVRLGFIGLGLRGINHLYNAINRNDVEVIAICDIDADR